MSGTSAWAGWYRASETGRGKGGAEFRHVGWVPNPPVWGTNVGALRTHPTYLDTLKTQWSNIGIIEVQSGWQGLLWAVLAQQRLPLLGLFRLRLLQNPCSPALFPAVPCPRSNGGCCRGCPRHGFFKRLAYEPLATAPFRGGLLRNKAWRRGQDALLPLRTEAKNSYRRYGST